MEQRETCNIRDGEGGYARTKTGVAGARALPTRREFLTSALTVSGVALSGPPRSAMAQTPAPVPPTGSAQDPLEIAEIPSQGGKLRAVITVQSGDRMMPADPKLKTDARLVKLRYFKGESSDGNLVWPPAPSAPGVVPPARPGPTLRARVGDQVEITFLNHIKVDEFGSTIDRVETGLGCDARRDTSGNKLYPEEAGDSAPDCFHGSSTVNIHFHGTHVTPDGLGDNVLLQLRPKPEITAALVHDDFAQIFAAGPPAHWGDLPRTWRDMQLKLLKEYDDTAAWQGQHGTPGNPALPRESRLLPQAKASIDRGDWPQYQIGAHPFCFQLTEYTKDAQGNAAPFVMGQCPGTHWYHAHKHGSTAINVLNGMAGVFVIEGAYDDALKKTYPMLQEKVLIVQNFSERPNLTDKGRGKFVGPSLWVNGQLSPTITMRPGEIQLWRLVNASVRAVTTLVGFGSDSGVPQIRQIAQDGVQFRFENFDTQPLIGELRRTGAPPFNTFAPGNRVDILVKAPDQAPPTQSKPYKFKVIDTTTGGPFDDPKDDIPILTVTVSGEPIRPAMEFPTVAQYPAFPHFLEDITQDEIRIWRRLDFSWEPNRAGPGAGSHSPAPKFMIDGKQFKDGIYNQTMVLGDAEEWTLTNSTAQIAHPFHIHINPFQVIEVFDPNSGKTYPPKGNYVWQDVIAIPPAKVDDQGKVVQPGYVKIRHRFVDFPGSYVLHCHMLAHEDRGMMQLVRVVSAEALVQHH
jgi:FtsP/CotA-like multicopper oxidase with cupredoxin domain